VQDEHQPAGPTLEVVTQERARGETEAALEENVVQDVVDVDEETARCQASGQWG